MFDIDKILGNKKTKKNVKFTDMTLSNTFGKNPFSDIVGNITNKPLKNMGASMKMQNKWKRMTSPQRNKARKKYRDSDGDRVPDIFDCSPFNTMKQDINFGRKPRGITQEQWKQQKDILNKSTFKTNTSLDPLTKMNTILEHDKELKQLNKVNMVFHDENWQQKFNQKSIDALKKQGYNDDDAIEFLGNRNKTRADAAAYFAQELAKDEKVGHLFPGAIPDIPMTREEGRERYERLQNQSKFIKGVGTVSEVVKDSGNKEKERKQSMVDFWGFDPEETYTPTDENHILNKKTSFDIPDKDRRMIEQQERDYEEMQHFEYEQEAEAQKHLKKLKQKPYNKLTHDEREFVDAMSTDNMNMREMEEYYDDRAKEINTTNPKDRWQTYDDIYEKESEGKPLTQAEKDYGKYHDLVDEDYTKLSTSEKDFLKTYRYKQGFDEDVFEGENDEVDSEEEFYKWKDNRR